VCLCVCVGVSASDCCSCFVLLHFKFLMRIKFIIKGLSIFLYFLVESITENNRKNTKTLNTACFQLQVLTVYSCT